jgi:hypothetical protein
MNTQTQTQTPKQYQVITGETYEVFGHRVRRIYRVDGKVVPIIPTSAIPHVIRIVYGLSYFEDSKCLECDIDYSHGLDGYILAPEGAIVLIMLREGWKCGIVDENSTMKIAEYGPAIKNVREIECPSMEEIGNEHARLINSGYCVDGLHADWRIMALLIAKRIYGIEV